MSVSGETRSASDPARIWRRELEQWQAALQRFLTETMVEVHELIEIAESQVQQESDTRVRQSPTASPDSSTVQPSEPTVPAKVHREARLPAGGSKSSERSDSGKDLVTSSPSTQVPGMETSDDRLAQLARRLEEKLEQSSSKAQKAQDMRNNGGKP